MASTHYFHDSSKWLAGLMLMVSILASCAPQHTSVARKEEQYVSFRMVNRIPVVNGRINGKSAWFIIDTGASVSVLNAAEARYFGFHVANTVYHEARSINGLGGRSNIYDVSGCDLEIGQLPLKYIAWQGQDMHALFRAIHDNEEIRIAGIIGSDVLSKYRISIHYNKLALSYRPPRHVVPVPMTTDTLSIAPALTSLITPHLP
ncbi:retroviral-like aspartic protease family protein [Fulvivirgaceae bacterium PWU5]|uniref:Retroviral-like aspartic protease family protein n=1 Tax=Dawidia cretensis TaxID=2782350 RepID=A0AAP2GP78_9BACT|nr:retropepsin-like aspartic protease [Dawidia cretensis]MBT1708341.1 retroviral-like aspartic protease family protein [Dawidia cretensis]